MRSSTVLKRAAHALAKALFSGVGQTDPVCDGVQRFLRYREFKKENPK
jgi:hypothetical protein